MTVVTADLARGQVGAVPATAPVPRMLFAAIALTCYLTWRPLDVMFTLSDALFLAAALGLARAGRLQPLPFGALTAAWIAGFALLAAGLLLGSLANGDPLRWAIAVAQYGFAFLVLPMLIVGQERAVVTRMAQWLVGGVAAMELFGISVYHLWDASYRDYKVLGLDFVSGAHRLGAFVSDGNWNGAVIAMTMPFVIHLNANRDLPGWVALPLLGILGWAAVLAASVSAMLCAGGGVLTLALVGRLRGTWWAIAAMVLALALYFAAGGSVPDAFAARVLPAIENGSLQQAGSFTGRLALMHEAWQLVGDHLLVGMGVDQYRVHSVQGAPVHNLFLLLWTEGGLLALAGWLLMMATLAAFATQALAADRLSAALLLAILFSLVIAANGSPHMYARIWAVPVLIAAAFVRRPDRAFRPAPRNLP